jgi:hypothetical protein
MRIAIRGPSARLVEDTLYRAFGTLCAGSPRRLALRSPLDDDDHTSIFDSFLARFD